MRDGGFPAAFANLKEAIMKKPEREALATPPAEGEEAAAATWNLLNAAQPPSAIVYDTDSMAVAGLDVARRVGLRIPWDLSILACND